MVKLSGRYQLTENVNYKELLLNSGLPEDTAKALNDMKLICSVDVDDKKFVINYESPINHTTTFEYGKEVTEKVPLLEKEGKSTATLQGETITVVTANGDKKFTRIFTFSETGAEIKMSNGSVEAKRIFKKL